MNKKILSLLIAGIMLFSVSAFAEGEEDIAPAFASQIEISLKIGENKLVADNFEVELDAPACIVNDRTMIPMRAIFELMGASVQWDGETRTVYGLREDVVVVMQIGQNYMFINTDKIELDQPSIIINDRTMVPLRAVAEAYGCEVGYDAETQTVTIVKTDMILPEIAE